jgi:hypothetical protein
MNNIIDKIMVLRASVGLSMFHNGTIVLDESQKNILEWNIFGIAQPTTSELEAVDMTTEQIVMQTRDQRNSAYPNWRDQMEMIYKDMKNGTSTYVDTIDAVKDKYPKPE